MSYLVWVFAPEGASKGRSTDLHTNKFTGIIKDFVIDFINTRNFEGLNDLEFPQDLQEAFCLSGMPANNQATNQIIMVKFFLMNWDSLSLHWKNFILTYCPKEFLLYSRNMLLRELEGYNITLPNDHIIMGDNFLMNFGDCKSIHELRDLVAGDNQY